MKILDFRLFLTIVLVVICFWGDRFSSISRKENRVQNLSFIRLHVSDHGSNDKGEEVAKDLVEKGSQSVHFERNNVKHTLHKTVKELP